MAETCFVASVTTLSPGWVGGGRGRGCLDSSHSAINCCKNNRGGGHTAGCQTKEMKAPTLKLQDATPHSPLLPTKKKKIRCHHIDAERPLKRAEEAEFSKLPTGVRTGLSGSEETGRRPRHNAGKTWHHLQKTSTESDVSANGACTASASMTDK